MAAISAYDSSSIGILFSSLNTSSTSKTGTSDWLGISYIDYATIQSGSYYKLLSAYYDENRNISGVTPSTSTAKDDTKTLASIESAANDMKESAAALQTKGSKSLFNEVTITDEDGNKTTGYDTDAIYKAVESFVSDYNSLIDAAAESDTTNILRAARNMVNYSSVNERLLNKIGITIGSDNNLSVDEEAFRKADMSQVQSLFQDRGGYGYQVMTQASLIETYAKSEAMKANTYGSTGMYTYNYTTGELYNSTI